MKKAKSKQSTDFQFRSQFSVETETTGERAKVWPPMYLCLIVSCSELVLFQNTKPSDWPSSPPGNPSTLRWITSLVSISLSRLSTLLVYGSIRKWFKYEAATLRLSNKNCLHVRDSPQTGVKDCLLQKHSWCCAAADSDWLDTTRCVAPCVTRVVICFHMTSSQEWKYAFTWHRHKSDNMLSHHHKSGNMLSHGIVLPLTGALYITMPCTTWGPNITNTENIRNCVKSSKVKRVRLFQISPKKFCQYRGWDGLGEPLPSEWSC